MKAKPAGTRTVAPKATYLRCSQSGQRSRASEPAPESQKKRRFRCMGRGRLRVVGGQPGWVVGERLGGWGSAAESGHEAAAGDGVVVWSGGEACGVEEVGVFGGTVAFALGAVHEEGGVFGDVERAGFVRIDEGVVDDEKTAFGESGGGDGEELGDFGDVPVVEDIGEEVDVGVVGEACEHVACGDGDLGGAIAGGDEIGGDAVDGGLVEDDGVEVWVGGGEGAGVDAGAAADVDEVVV